jgi:hypothetical protein
MPKTAFAPAFPSEEKGWARLYDDQTVDSAWAFMVLQNHGFRVYSFPAEHDTGPRVVLNGRVCLGIDEIVACVIR